MCNRSYWSTNSPFMSGRFQLLMKIFHLNNAEKQPDRTSDNYDKIYKIWLLFDLVSSKGNPTSPCILLIRNYPLMTA